MGPPVLFADGLAIFTHAVSKNNYGREKSLVAFDGTSGEQKWRVDEVGPDRAHRLSGSTMESVISSLHPSWGMLPVCGWPMAR